MRKSTILTVLILILSGTSLAATAQSNDKAVIDKYIVSQAKREPW